MDIFDTNVKQISGPINVIRMEGNIHGIHKVLYLFMDWHENIHNQSECVNVFSKDLNKYLAENFYKLNGTSTKYDFFMEVRPTDIIPPIEIGTRNLIPKKIYISQVIKFFSSVFTYDKEKDAVKISNTFKNVRLHYLDIRDYFKYHVLDLLESSMHISYEFMYHMYVNTDRLLQIIDDLKIAKQELDKTIVILDSNPQELQNEKLPLIKQYKGFESQTIERIVKKIRQSYSHPDIKKVLISYFNEYIDKLDDLSKEIQITIDSFIKDELLIRNNYGKLTLDKNNRYGYGIDPVTHRGIIVDIVNRCEMLYSECIRVFARLTDVYFLRRFLDKDYITNGIVYSGASHSETYIKILVSDFNFKVTHYAYSTIPNIEDLNKEIKKLADDNKDITFILNPTYLYQCSDITNFPEKFM